MSLPLPPWTLVCVLLAWVAGAAVTALIFARYVRFIGREPIRTTLSHSEDPRSVVSGALVPAAFSTHHQRPATAIASRTVAARNSTH